MTKTAPDPVVSAVTEWNEVIRDRLGVRAPLAYTARPGSPFLKLKVGDELRELVEDPGSGGGPKKRWAQVRIVALSPGEGTGATHVDMESIHLMESGLTAKDLKSCSACNHIWNDHRSGQACSICFCPRFRHGTT